jgi:hypothetical protein
MYSRALWSGGAFGLRGPAFLLALPVAVVSAGDHEVLTRVALALERAVRSADDRLVGAQAMLGGDRREIDHQLLRDAALGVGRGKDDRARNGVPGGVTHTCCRNGSTCEPAIST